MITLLVGCKANYHQIDMEEAYKTISLDDSIVVLDVRTKEEYEEKHIKRAINIPLDDISSITLDKKTTIYVYCQSGARSKEASNKLVEMGYTNIYDMGGFNNWHHEVE